MVKTFKNISTVGVHCQYMIDAFEGFYKQIIFLKKVYFRVTHYFHLNSKTILKSSPWQGNDPFP